MENQRKRILKWCRFYTAKCLQSNIIPNINDDIEILDNIKKDYNQFWYNDNEFGYYNEDDYYYISRRIRCTISDFLYSKLDKILKKYDIDYDDIHQVAEYYY